MSLREKLQAIDGARSPNVRWSIGQYVERCGMHPGGQVEQAKENFMLALVEEIERLQREVAALRAYQKNPRKEKVHGIPDHAF